MVTRAATEQDDLVALWPELADCRVNPEQVFVVTHEDGTLLGGSLVFHGGHGMAYIGSTVILAPERRVWIAKALLEHVTAWLKERGVTRIGHGAGTPECIAAFLRLGAKATRPHVLMELRI